jgi:hypothetical protein
VASFDSGGGAMPLCNKYILNDDDDDTAVGRWGATRATHGTYPASSIHRSG